MSEHRARLEASMREFNLTEIAKLITSTDLTCLSLNGPADAIFTIGPVRVRGLFVGSNGVHWADGALLVESLDPDPATREALLQAIATELPDCHDLWIATASRGIWNALISPVSDLAILLGYPPANQMPADNWARTWGDSPERTDEQELAWVAGGGKCTSSYRKDSIL
jgi:hypothetical protein